MKDEEREGRRRRRWKMKGRRKNSELPAMERVCCLLHARSRTAKHDGMAKGKGDGGWGLR